MCDDLAKSAYIGRRITHDCGGWRVYLDMQAVSMGHACELETSLVLATRPDLVHGEGVPPDGARHFPNFGAKTCSLAAP
jgi:creatinine amidohydrolase/Fe(II)-dependent formamide hydrolase-like protein